MEKPQKTTIFTPACLSSPFEIRRSPADVDISPAWKKSSPERANMSRHIRDTKIVTSVISSGTVSRRSKNVNRSPRQVRRNERERGRKARLNAAFKVLRNVIPFYTEGLNKEKLTQVQVLRLAAKYIMTLSDILGSESSENEEEIFSSQLHGYRMSYDIMSFAASQ